MKLSIYCLKSTAIDVLLEIVGNFLNPTSEKIWPTHRFSDGLSTDSRLDPEGEGL